MRKCTSPLTRSNWTPTSSWRILDKDGRVAGGTTPNPDYHLSSWKLGTSYGSFFLQYYCLSTVLSYQIGRSFFLFHKVTPIFEALLGCLDWPTCLNLGSATLLARLFTLLLTQRSSSESTRMQSCSPPFNELIIFCTLYTLRVLFLIVSDWAGVPQHQVLLPERPHCCLCHLVLHWQLPEQCWQFRSDWWPDLLDLVLCPHVL